MAKTIEKTCFYFFLSFLIGCTNIPKDTDIYAFHTMLARGDYSHVSELVDKYPTIVNSPLVGKNKNECLSVLTSAVSSGDTEFVKYILELGTSINPSETELYTSLQLAISHNDYSMTKLLLERGADYSTKNLYGESVYHDLAMNNRDPAIFALFKEDSASIINDCNNDGYSPLFFLIQELISSKEYQTTEGYNYFVLFLEAGADISSMFQKDNDIVWLIKNKENRYIETLLDFYHGTLPPRLSGSTYLQTALFYENWELVPELIPFVDINHQNNQGQTALMYAVTKNAPFYVLEALVNAGADVGLVTNNGLNAYDYYQESTEIPDTKILKLLR